MNEAPKKALLEKVFSEHSCFKKWVKKIPLYFYDWAEFSDPEKMFSFHAWKNNKILDHFRIRPSYFTSEEFSNNFKNFARAYCLTKQPDIIAYFTQVTMWLPNNPALPVWQTPETAQQITSNLLFRNELMHTKTFLFVESETRNELAQFRWPIKNLKLGKPEIIVHSKNGIAGLLDNSIPSTEEYLACQIITSQALQMMER